jgi:hypothetical protein
MIGTWVIDAHVARILLHGVTFPKGTKFKPGKCVDYMILMERGEWDINLSRQSWIVRSGTVLKNGLHRLSAIASLGDREGLNFTFPVAILGTGQDITPEGKVIQL